MAVENRITGAPEHVTSVHAARVLVLAKAEEIAQCALRLLRSSGSVKTCEWFKEISPWATSAFDTLVYLPSLAKKRMIPDLDEAEQTFRLAGCFSHVVVASSAAVYVPSARSTGFHTESEAGYRYRKGEIARAWMRFEELAKVRLFLDSRLTILRPATVLARGLGDYFVDLLEGRMACTLPGFDPSLQFLSPEDFAEALGRAIENSPGGVYNVAPDGTVPLRTALRMAKTRRVPVPRSVQRPVRRLLAPLQTGVHPIGQTDYIRYPWTISNSKIKHDLEFRPRQSSFEALGSFIRGLGVCDNYAALVEELDPFGMDKRYVAAFGRSLFRFLHDFYWRVEECGFDNVPAKGPGVLVGVHRGLMPWDGVMALHGIVQNVNRYPRFLVHPALFRFPFLFNFMTKLGGIPASQQNGDWVLGQGELLGIFPEGIRGTFARYKDAYKLGRFWRDDFVRLALRNRVPIIPFVTVGSAEIFPILAGFNWRWWKDATYWPYFPITPTFPLLPVPLPSKWHTTYMGPIHVEAQYPPEAADDPTTVAHVSSLIQGRMQEELNRILRHRKGIFFGSIFPAEANR